MRFKDSAVTFRLLSMPGSIRALGSLHRTARTRAAALLIASVILTAGTYVVPMVFESHAGDGATPYEAPLPGVANPPAGAAPGDGDRQDVDERIAFWSGRVQQQPSDFLSLIQLGLTYAEKGRLAADLGSYERASAAIDRALAVSPSYPPAIRARAALRYALHDFEGAEADARTVLAKAPTDTDALASLADAQLELGRLDEASSTLARLATLTGGPAIDVRLARLAYLRGDRAEALTDARRASNTADGSDPVARGFYAFALGEYARLNGWSDEARAAYESVLQLRASDLGALVGLARVDAASGREEAAIAGLRRAAAIAPQPETLALLGDLLAIRGDAAGADEAYATVRAIRKLSELARRVYDRPLLLFELDHAGSTAGILDAARAGLAQRSDAGGHDLVAWAAYRQGNLALARSEIELALATGIRDARILYHAGAILVAGGVVDGGQERLKEALALGPALGPVDTAEAHRLLGR
jgi:tetratricopeptide (TPR) repeat protein